MNHPHQADMGTLLGPSWEAPVLLPRRNTAPSCGAWVNIVKEQVRRGGRPCRTLRVGRRTRRPGGFGACRTATSVNARTSGFPLNALAAEMPIHHLPLR